MDVQCTTTKAQRLISFSTVGKLDNNVFLKADVLPNQSRTSVHSAGVFPTSTDIVEDMGRPVAMLLRSYGSIEGKYSMKVQNAVSKRTDSDVLHEKAPSLELENTTKFSTKEAE
ncbi:hypothetical protein MHYP_G00363160 [Metynnis hypsauchen]